MTATFEGTIGILLAGQLKDFVEKEIFKGRKLSIYIGRGWLSKSFCIRGDFDDVDFVRKVLIANFGEGASE